MNINIICVGKLKEKYLRDASAEYEKRLSRYCRVQIRELKEARLAENASPAEEEAVKTEEGKSILKALSSSSFVIVLDIGGKELSSDQLAEKIGSLATTGESTVDFIIGGSLGLSEEVKKERISVSLFHR